MCSGLWREVQQRVPTLTTRQLLTYARGSKSWELARRCYSNAPNDAVRLARQVLTWRGGLRHATVTPAMSAATEFHCLTQKSVRCLVYWCQEIRSPSCKARGLSELPPQLPARRADAAAAKQQVPYNPSAMRCDHMSNCTSLDRTKSSPSRVATERSSALTEDCGLQLV